VIPIFVVNVYQEDEALLRQCLKSIRAFYPTAPLVMISDGNQNMLYSDIAFEVKARLVIGSRLKVPACSGSWTKRMYTEALREVGDTIIKMDPDSYMWRAFKIDPPGDYAGYLTDCPKGEYVHGGCKATSVNVARLVLEDFSSNKYVSNPAVTYLKNGERILSDDLLTADVMRGRSIPLTFWSEVTPIPLKSPAIYAVTHGYQSAVQ